MQSARTALRSRVCCCLLWFKGLQQMNHCSSVPAEPGHSHQGTAGGSDATTVAVMVTAMRSSSAAATNSWDQKIQDEQRGMHGVMPSGLPQLCSSSSSRDDPRRLKRT